MEKSESGISLQELPNDDQDEAKKEEEREIQAGTLISSLGKCS